MRHEPGKLIGGNGHADAAGADQDSPLGLASGNTQRNLAAKIWVVDGFAPLGSATLRPRRGDGGSRPSSP